MGARTINPFPFQLALLLLLSFVRTEAVQAEEFPATNFNASLGDTLTDAEIKTIVWRTNDGWLRLMIRTLAGRRYSVESTSSLFGQEWSTVRAWTGSGVTEELDEPLTLDQRFYRARLETR